jgi:hypothetical protein
LNQTGSPAGHPPSVAEKTSVGVGVYMKEEA